MSVISNKTSDNLPSKDTEKVSGIEIQGNDGAEKQDSDSQSELSHLKHHVQGKFCSTRPSYRQGRELKAVKVYTVNKESQHLMIYNVPDLKLRDELYCLCQKHGQVISVSSPSNDHLPKGEFTEVYHVHYQSIKSARFAKKQLDNREFFGSLLHVCYAPELESVEETRLKLSLRRKDIVYRTLLNSTSKRQFLERKIEHHSNSEFRSMFNLTGVSNDSSRHDHEKVERKGTAAAPTSLPPPHFPKEQSPSQSGQSGDPLPMIPNALKYSLNSNQPLPHKNYLGSNFNHAPDLSQPVNGPSSSKRFKPRQISRIVFHKS